MNKYITNILYIFSHLRFHNQKVKQFLGHLVILNGESVNRKSFFLASLLQRKTHSLLATSFALITYEVSF